MVSSPTITVGSDRLSDDATQLGRVLGKLGSNVEKLLRRYQEDIVDRQYQLQRVAEVATEIYVSVAVLRRLDAILSGPGEIDQECEDAVATGRYYLLTANRRMQQNLIDLWSNDDQEATQLADRMLAKH
jgi:hypothetical protein